MTIKSVKDIETKGKKVLLRVDFNVPLADDGSITDDSRIRAALPTIQYLINKKAKIILASHLGRPKGKIVNELRMTGIAQRLSQILKQQVKVAKDCIGPEVTKLIEKLQDGEVLLLENIRFHPEEEKNDAGFAKAMAQLADVYVNDAFGASHRAHASIEGITEYLPSVAGMLLEKELKTLGNILENPSHPFGGLLGGAKISDKVAMMENIMDKVDYLIVGGGMAATFLKAKSYNIGLSLIESDMLDTAAKLMKMASSDGIRLLLPVDVIIADELSPEAKVVKTTPVENIDSNLRIVDIGPQTIKIFSEVLRKCKTVFWNGPMGIYEIPRFSEGTKAMARLLVDLNATTVVGGGSTAEIVNEMGLAEKMTFVSTGGGASLRFLSGQKLPGVEALRNKE